MPFWLPSSQENYLGGRQAVEWTVGQEKGVHRRQLSEDHCAHVHHSGVRPTSSAGHPSLPPLWGFCAGSRCYSGRSSGRPPHGPLPPHLQSLVQIWDFSSPQKTLPTQRAHPVAHISDYLCDLLPQTQLSSLFCSLLHPSPGKCLAINICWLNLWTSKLKSKIMDYIPEN